MAAPARRLDAQFSLLGGAPAPSPAPLLRPILLPDPPPPEPGESDALRRLRASLAPEIAARLGSASELVRAIARERRDDLLPTTLEPFDALLGGGLPRGKVVEIASRRAAGRFSVVTAALAAATSAGEAAVLVDLGDHFDPQIAEAAGVDLRRTLWIRPGNLKQAVMSAEMITASGFQLVILDAGLHPIRGRRVPDAAWVRLARAAEAHGAAMLVSAPYPLAGTASEAVVTARTLRAKWIGRRGGPRLLAGTSIEMTLEKHRQMRTGRTAVAELSAVSSQLSGGGGPES